MSFHPGTASDYREWARHGWLKRHGITAVPDESKPYIRAGVLTIPQARCELVYALIIASDRELLLKDIARALKLHHFALRRSVDLLERDGYVARAGRYWRAVRQPGPSWRDYARLAA